MKILFLTLLLTGCASYPTQPEYPTQLPTQQLSSNCVYQEPCAYYQQELANNYHQEIMQNQQLNAELVREQFSQIHQTLNLFLFNRP